MFIPKHFEITDDQEIVSFIETNAFGQLISNVDGRPFSTHIPFLLSEDRSKLLAHFAKQNPQAKNVDNQEVLVSLQGEHDYISPSWYLGAGVPTWNYQAVHIYGRCETFSDPTRLKKVVEDLAEKYESDFPEPWIPEYKPSMLEGIVGIEVNISEVQCQYKLSQNRPPKDREQVVEALRLSGSIRLAEAMQKNEQ